MDTGTHHYYYQAKLSEELAKRVEKNSHYSLRSFANTLGIGPSALSLILSNKRPISTKVIDKIFKVLELSEVEKRMFLESVLKEKKQRGLTRISPAIKLKIDKAQKSHDSEAVHGIGLDQFRIIADWYHNAILALANTTRFQSNIKWIAKELGISELEAKLAVERLLRLDLLEERGGKWMRTNLKTDTKDKNKTSAFHKKRQKQILEKSIASLQFDPIEERNHTGLTFPIDPDRMAEAKIKIQNFMWELSKFMMDEKKERVYELNVSFFPLQSHNVQNNKKENHNDQK